MWILSSVYISISYYQQNIIDDTVFSKIFKQSGLPCAKTVLFCQKYGNNLGNKRFIWKEIESESNATERNEVFNQSNLNSRSTFLEDISTKLRKWCLWLCQNKITSGQFHSMCRDMTGDDSVADNSISKEVDDWVRIILRDLRKMIEKQKDLLKITSA